MPTFHLLRYDGELLFHNGREMEVLKSYEAPTLIEAAEAIVQDPTMMEKLYDQAYGHSAGLDEEESAGEREQQYKEFITMSASDLLEHFALTRKESENPAFLLVDGSEQLYQVLVEGRCITTSSRRGITIDSL